MIKKKLAIENFKKQIDELEDLNYVNRAGWKAFTIEIIIKYLGPDSKFLPPFTNRYYFTDVYDYGKDIQTAKTVLLQCIKYIEANEVYKDPNSNFISRMSEGWAIFWAGTLIAIFYTTGYFVGDYTAKNKIESQKIDYQDSIKRLNQEKSLLMIQLAKKPTSPKSSPDTTQKNNEVHDSTRLTKRK